MYPRLTDLIFSAGNLKSRKTESLDVLPREDNYLAFRKKIKAIINNSNYGAFVKAKKLSPIVRGWRNYHRYCKMDGSRFTLWFTRRRAWNVFNRESKLNRHQTDALIDKAFPAVPYSENKHVMVKGDASPFNSDIAYWSIHKIQLLRWGDSQSTQETRPYMRTMRT